MKTTASPKYEQGTRVINIVGKNETPAKMPIIDYKLVGENLLLNPEQVKVSRSANDLFISLPEGDPDRPDIMIADYHPQHSVNLVPGMFDSTKQDTSIAVDPSIPTLSNSVDTLSAVALDIDDKSATNPITSTNDNNHYVPKEVSENTTYSLPYIDDPDSSSSAAWWVFPLGLLGAGAIFANQNSNDDDEDKVSANTNINKANASTLSDEKVLAEDSIFADGLLTNTQDAPITAVASSVVYNTNMTAITNDLFDTTGIAVI